MCFLSLSSDKLKQLLLRAGLVHAMPQTWWIKSTTPMALVVEPLLLSQPNNIVLVFKKKKKDIFNKIALGNNALLASISGLITIKQPDLYRVNN